MKHHKSNKFKRRNDRGRFFFTRTGVWRDPLPGQIIYLPGSDVQHKCDKNGNVWFRSGHDSKGRERWILRFFSELDIANRGHQKVPGLGLFAYSLTEPEVAK